MHFRIHRLRDRGIAKTKARLKKEQPYIGDVFINVEQDNPLGRASRVAYIHHGGPAGTHPLPPLYDAEVHSMAPLAMIITGVEEFDGVMYAQSWWCRTA